MKHPIQRILAGSLVALACGAGPAVATTADGLTRGTDVASASDALDAMIFQLVSKNVGTSYQEMYEAVIEVAKATDTNPISIAESALKETSDAFGGSRYNVGANLPIGLANNKGDVFYSPVSTALIPHGHTGIYYSQTHIVEAPGPGQSPRNTLHTNVPVASGTQKQYVNTTQANRNAAANLANTYVGRAYNLNFAFNKTANGAMNCSQLVWAAYIESVGIDLDSNGGHGVYPSDIRDSGWTVTYQTIQ